MPADRSTVDTRVLLLPPTARDGEACRELLASSHVDCVLCDDLVEICEQLILGAAAIILPEEILLSESYDRLAVTIQQQPVWSDLPIIVLTRGAESSASRNATSLLRNVSLVERPLRISTLLSVVNTALRARERQYQLRDHLMQREKAEAELRDARARLEDALSEAERAGRMKDEFLATLSHELRTPLNAILGWSQILRQGSKNEDDLAEGLETIERNARAQTQIIEDLLDMSRIISGKVRLDVKPIDLDTVIQASIETVKPAADARGIRIGLVVPPTTPSPHSPIFGDPNRLQQVFWNLLSNAIKFSPPRSEIHVCVEWDTANIHVSVIDSGEGIKPEFLPHVFDRFRQADSSTTRRHGGLGLGLSIVKQLVEMHGGTVRAQSAGAKRGSTFRVSLPLSSTREQAPSNPERPVIERLLSPTQWAECRDKIGGTKVLVVDDDGDARMLLKRLLEDCSAEVRVAASAAEAIDTLPQFHPDVLVSDIGMPGEDGYSLLRRVRSLGAEQGGDVPAIALTAYARAEDRARSIENGFQTHVTKPVDPGELITTVASLISEKV